MKFFSILVVALSALSSFAEGQTLEQNGNYVDASGVTIADVDLSMIGVRILLNNGQLPPPGMFCNATEQDLINTSVISTFANSNVRNLRATRHLKSCNKLCDGWPPGQCFLGNPRCQDWRRLDEIQHAEATYFEESIEFELGDERQLKPMDATQVQCKDEKQLAKKALRAEVYDEISQSCKDLLKQMLNLRCFLLT
jgi:hypothetical protein